MKLYTVLTTKFALNDLEVAHVVAVLDQRRKPMHNYNQLSERE